MVARLAKIPEIGESTSNFLSEGTPPHNLKKSEVIEGISCQTRTDARSKCRGKFICTMPCKKEENKVKPDAQHTKAYVSNRAIDVLVKNSPIRMIFQFLVRRREMWCIAKERPSG